MVDLILLLPGASIFVGAMTKQLRVPPVLPLNHFVLFVESFHNFRITIRPNKKSIVNPMDYFHSQYLWERSQIP
jgi:hypothetical protein